MNADSNMDAKFARVQSPAAGARRACPALNRYGQAAFCMVLIHFLWWGLRVGQSLVQELRDPMLASFSWRNVSVLPDSVLWINIHTTWIWAVLVVAEIAGLVVCYGFARHRRSRRWALSYVIFALGVILIHLAAVCWAVGVAIVRDPEPTFVFECPGVLLVTRGIPDIVLALPAVLVAVGLLISRRCSVPAGFCANCGYDLRATPHCCPECGTAVTSR